MRTRAGITMNSRGLGSLFWYGIAAYAISFLLPSMQTNSTGRPLYGYLCAWLSIAFLKPLKDQLISPSQLVGLSGLSNLILVAFLLSIRFFPNNRYRLVMAIATLLCSLCTIPSMVIFKATPTISYFVWMAGMWTILVSQTMARNGPHEQR